MIADELDKTRRELEAKKMLQNDGMDSAQSGSSQIGDRRDF